MPKRNDSTVQLCLLNGASRRKDFGGSLLKKSHAKTARPISTKEAMHVTLKSSHARGKRSFLASRQRRLHIEKIIHLHAKKFGLKIYRLAVVGNHLHLLVRASKRRGFVTFLRVVSGLIARISLGAERGKAQLTTPASFWDQRPWTRIVAWLRDFQNVKKYVAQNFDEAQGFALYKPRKYQSSA